MKKLLSMVLSLAVAASMAVTSSAEQQEGTGHMYQKGNFASSYNEIGHDPNSRAWRDGMVGGNGETGFVTSGSPYSDVFIFQHMYFNYPSSQPREIPSWLPEQLEEARLNIFNLNDSWKIWDYDANGNKVQRHRTFYYSYHPGAQLRLTSSAKTYSDYERWTNYETGEVGVRYTDSNGQWVRTTFTSRIDNVTITKIDKSSQGSHINMNISIDDIVDMCKGWNGMSAVKELRYKKIVDGNGDYITLAAHYPVYSGSPLYDGGYAGVTKIVVEGANAEKKRVVSANNNSDMNVGENASVEIKNAEAIYLITATDRSFEMTGMGESSSSAQIMDKFKAMGSYTLTDELKAMTDNAASKYTEDGKFSYSKALEPSAKEQAEEFNRVSFGLEGDEEYADYDNNALISLQRGTTDKINHEFMRRSYEQARYAQVCCGGTTAPRLYGMWTGEWNPGWRGIYTLDANVNLQVSAMNTGHLTDMPLGYITFFLRHAPDFLENARMAYGMHDAIQPSVNADADRAMHVEYDSAYPFEYWNAGASWCLLPIYEYWQCYGNCQIPINDYMRFDDLQKVLGVNDGGLTDEEFAALKAKGCLDLEEDILLPLLTKQANFWEQIVTPRYYTDINGNACHDESKTELGEGEKYIIIPTYSPENNPIGYTSTLTANATMDISAARDGLDMVCVIEKAVGREGSAEAIEKWQKLKNNISDYKTDSDGALREWAMNEYTENNNHRHLSHLYVAWPAYDTQNDPELAKASNIALNNRNKFNTGDATAGHGWMHKALVEARLKRGDGMVSSLLKMMNGTAYYSSLMTDHDTNRRNDTYCTDTAFGTLGAINEALVFSNTGEIEIVPALPSDWTKGEVKGLMSRSRAEITDLSWDFENKTASTVLTSNSDENEIKVRCGEIWNSAIVDGQQAEVLSDEVGKYVVVNLNNGDSTEIVFELDATGNTVIVKNGEEIVEDSLEMNVGETVELTAETLKNSYEAADWTGDSIGVVTVDNGKITALNPGSANLTVSVGTLKKVIKINVLGTDKIYKSAVVSTSGSEGYNSSWAPENAFDANPATAYSSKDNAGGKYLEAELEAPKAVTQMYVIGRYTAADGDGAFDNRINGAKVYASNAPLNGNVGGGVLVGTVSGVTATSEFIPAKIEIDTKGEEYKYYTVYFDTVNNGSAVSMAVAEIAFYTDKVGGRFIEMDAELTATAGANPAAAADKNSNTSYYLENSSAIGDEYLLVELDGKTPVYKVVIGKQKNAGGTSDNNYWADWVLSVGCEVQGSFDGEAWETIGVMNTWPDGTDNTSEAVFNLDAPKEYKYIRYIRTTYKTSSAYGAWKFKSDNGNRLNVAEISVYTYDSHGIKIIDAAKGDNSVVFTVESAVDGSFKAFLADYDKDGKLLAVTTIAPNISSGTNRYIINIEEKAADAMKTILYIWDESMCPAAAKVEVE